MSQYGVPFVSKFIIIAGIQKSLRLGIYESSGHYLRKLQQAFDVNYRRYLEMLQLWGFMKVVDIYVNLTGRHCVNCSGYLHIVCDKILQWQTFSDVAGQEFTKIVDVYKKNTVGIKINSTMDKIIQAITEPCPMLQLPSRSILSSRR